MLSHRGPTHRPAARSAASKRPCYRVNAPSQAPLAHVTPSWLALSDRCRHEWQLGSPTRNAHGTEPLRRCGKLTTSLPLTHDLFPKP